MGGVDGLVRWLFIDGAIALVCSAESEFVLKTQNKAISVKYLFQKNYFKTANNFKTENKCKFVEKFTIKQKPNAN